MRNVLYNYEDIQMLNGKNEQAFYENILLNFIMLQ